MTPPPPPPFRIFSIRWRLVIIFLAIALLPMAVSSLILQYQTTTALEAAARSAATSTALTAARDIDRVVDSTISALFVETLLPGVSLFPEQQNDEQTRQYAKATLSTLFRKDPIHILSYSIVSVTGEILLDSSSNHIGENIAGEEIFQETLKSKAPRASSIQKLPGGIPTINFAAPIYDHNGDISGLLVARYNAAYITRFVTQRPPFGPGSFAILTRPDNTVIAHSLAPGEEGQPLQFLAGAAHLTEPEATFSDFGQFPQGHCFAAAATTRNQRWHVVCAQPEKLFLLPIRQQSRAAWATALATAILVIAAALAAASHLSGPITRLTTKIGQYTAGRADITITPETNDEIGLLALACSSMIAEIRQRTLGLQEAITQLEDAKHAAEAASLAKSQFIANMSHELRTPLNAIIGYSELLRETAADDGNEEYTADLRKIHDAGRHLLTLINDVLDFSKIEAGKMHVHCEDFDLDELIRETTETAAPLMAVNTNHFTVANDLPPGFILHSDITKIRQILLNLLSNSAKFTRHGQITLEISLPIHTHIRLAIRDEGIGMTRQQLDGLFQPFTQADLSTTRKYGGTGLGLTLTKQFTEMLGGSIAATSVPDIGSTFFVTLPVNFDPAARNNKTPAPANTPAPLPPSTAGRGNLHILVIDDDPIAQDILATQLRGAGFLVHCADSGPQGLAHARLHPPAAITLDIMMPGMDGWKVLSQIKGDKDLRHIPVILISMLDRDTTTCIDADDYLCKPVAKDELLASLAKCIQPGPKAGILIVEDDPATMDVTTNILEKIGFTVACAPNGQVALDLLGSRPDTPQAILLDLAMPVMDGFQFLTLLRANPAWTQIPVIIFTARDLTPHDRRTLQECTTRILQKGGYTRTDLTTALQRAIERNA